MRRDPVCGRHKPLRLSSLVADLTRNLPQNAELGDNVGKFTLLDRRGSEAQEKLMVQRQLHVQRFWRL